MRNAILLIAGLLTGLSFASQTLTLEECVTAAQTKYASVRSNQQDLQAAKETRSQAQTHWFPTVTAQATALRSQDYLVKMNNAGGNLPVYNGNPATLGAATEYAYMPPSEVGLVDRMGVAMLSVTQGVYLGGRIQNANRLAQIGVDVSQIQLELAQIDATVQTSTRYWNLVALHSKQKALQAQMLLLDTLAQDVRRALQNGLATSRDTLDIYLSQQEAKNYMQSLDEGIALAELDLCRSLDGYCSGSLILLDTLGAVENPKDLYVDHDAALVKRKETVLINKSVDAQVAQGKMKSGEFLPQVLIGAAVMEISDFQNAPVQNAIVFANLSVPISGLWEGHHQRKERSFKENKARVDALENQRLLGLEINQAWNTYNANWRQWQHANTSINKQKQSLEDSRVGFHAGMQKASDVVEAQLKLQAALDQEVTTKNSLLQSRINYLRTTARYEVMR